jgi:type IV pilus assembly protein PilA
MLLNRFYIFFVHYGVSIGFVNLKAIRGWKRLKNRRKDGGFTLIELMIVIAVIGILAIVLVPKMSNVKDSAKAAGVTTNAKSIEMFVVANIDKWSQSADPDAAAIAAIKAQFASGAQDALKNPFTGEVGELASSKGAFSVAASPENVKGAVAVKVPDNLDGGITIMGYGSQDSDKIYEQTVKSK